MSRRPRNCKWSSTATPRMRRSPLSRLKKPFTCQSRSKIANNYSQLVQSINIGEPVAAGQQVGFFPAAVEVGDCVGGPSRGNGSGRRQRSASGCGSEEPSQYRGLQQGRGFLNDGPDHEWGYPNRTPRLCAVRGRLRSSSTTGNQGCRAPGPHQAFRSGQDRADAREPPLHTAATAYGHSPAHRGAEHPAVFAWNETAWRRRCWTKSSVWVHLNRCCRTPRSTTSW